ncbi:secretory subunit [Quaeritorhiza haematococci]|nr:secretory subunit [Quaeritorhiza haematococci]
MAKYNYDETGATFTFFVLSMLAIILFPTTFFSLFGGKKQSSKGSDRYDYDAYGVKKKIKSKEEKDKPLISTKFVLLAIGWAIFAVVCYKAATTTIEEKIWNPWAILDINEDATESQVKKAFRRLSLQWHPDKVEADMKEAAEDKFVEISKAYKVLTDPEARKNWEEFGHPDGKQSFTLGIALPAWLVTGGNSVTVLGVYALAFGIALPFWVSRWWSGAKNFTKDKIMHQTMGRFYREIKENMTNKSLVDLLTTADEFATIVKGNDGGATAKLADKVKRAMDEKSGDRFEKSKKYGAVIPWSYKVSVLLYAHFLRVPVENEALAQEQAEVVESAAKLVNGMLQIAISRNWLNIAMMVIDIGQMITQALYFNQPPVAQLPFVDEPAILKHFNTKKRNIRTIRDLLEMSPEDRSSLLRALEPEQLQKVETIARNYPLLKFRKAKFSVLGEPAIIPSAIVTLIVKLELITPEQLLEDKKTGRNNILADDDDDNDEETEEEKKPWWKSQENKCPPAHAPFFPVEKRPVWWVILGDMKQNRLITMTKVQFSQEKTVRLQFQAPPTQGQWVFQAIIKSDSFIGCDASVDVKLVVQPPEAAPLEDEDDDISEPEEDSIAGQMQAMRTGGVAGPAGAAAGGSKKKAPKGEYEDSSDDSDDEDGQEQGNGAAPEDDSDEEEGSDFVE